MLMGHLLTCLIAFSIYAHLFRLWTCWWKEGRVVTLLTTLAGIHFTVRASKWSLLSLSTPCECSHAISTYMMRGMYVVCISSHSSVATELFLVTVRNGQIHCLEILIRHGAVCMPSKDGIHPLDVCIKAGIFVYTLALPWLKGKEGLCVSCMEFSGYSK